MPIVEPAMWWLLLVVPVVSGLPGSYVANEKNRSNLEGFVFGFLLGPLGVLIEVLLATLQASTDIPIARPPQEPQKIADVAVWDVSDDPRMPKINL